MKRRFCALKGKKKKGNPTCPQAEVVETFPPSLSLPELPLLSHSTLSTLALSLTVDSVTGRRTTDCGTLSLSSTHLRYGFFALNSDHEINSKFYALGFVDCGI